MKDFFSKDINIIIFSFFFVIFMLAISQFMGQEVVTTIGVLITIVVLIASPIIIIKAYKNHKG
jgi:uncharacterized membrane protein YjgN (DUF898 family)